MKDRLVTLGGALLALLVVIGLFGGPGAGPEEGVARPLSTERRGAGLSAWAEWLSGEGIAVDSLRERYPALPQTPAGGHLLVASLPQLRPARYLELEALERWIASGNTLLALVALQDTQLWSMDASGQYLTVDLESLTGLRFETRVEEDENGTPGESEAAEDAIVELTSLEAREAVVEPRGPHPLLTGVERLEAASPLPSWVFELVAPQDVLLLELAHDRETGAGALWVRSLGEGQILISGYAGLFSNSTIGRADNRELAANLVAYAAGPGGSVIFDDMHQGLSTLYDPQALFADGRLYRTLGFLLALWLLWLVGASDRFAPAAAEPALAERDFIAAAGGFLARVSGPLPSARRLYELFFNELRQRAGAEQNGEPYWQPLRRSPILDPRLCRRLEDAYRQLAAGRAEPRAVHNLLLDVRRKLK